jgi:hypothetical protein
MQKNIHFSTYPPPTLIHLSRRFTRASKPAAQKYLTVVSVTSTPPFQNLRHQRNVCHPIVNRFTRQTLPALNMKRFSMNILCIEFFWPQERVTERYYLVLYSQARPPFWLLKPASEHAHARLLSKLFYFHLCPVYCLSHVIGSKFRCLLIEYVKSLRCKD